MSARYGTVEGRSGELEPVRARRSPREVDRLILDAARNLFASRGYTGTTTREIAARAGVHEPLLYRRYGSKEGLFRAAVMVPFGAVVSSYLEMWEAQITRPVLLRDLVVAFVDPLYTLLREHSELAMALVRARELIPGAAAGSDESVAWLAELGRVLQQLVPQLEHEGVRRALRVDAATTNIVVLGMVLGLALLDPVLPTSAVSTTPEQVSEAMVELILHGVTPPPGSPAPTSPGPTGPAPTVPCRRTFSWSCTSGWWPPGGAPLAPRRHSRGAPNCSPSSSPSHDLPPYPRTRQECPDLHAEETFRWSTPSPPRTTTSTRPR